MSDRTPKQVCPACSLLIDDYRQEDNGDSLDLFCPHCDEHIAHLDLETMRQLWDGAEPTGPDPRP